MNDPTPPPPSLEMIENQRMMQVMILVRNFHEIWGFRAWFDIGASLPTIPPSAGKQRKPTITYTHAYAYEYARAHFIHVDASNTDTL